MKTPILKNKWTYKIEPTRGYITSDKVDKGGEAYETGFSEYFTEAKKLWKVEVKSWWSNGKKMSLNLVDAVNEAVDAFCNAKLKTDNCKKTNVFYLNFNRDGIDVYIRRWIE